MNRLCLLLYMFLIFKKHNIMLANLRYYLTNGKPPKIKPFVPEDHGLSTDFVLTNYTKMKG